jgi:hypothetical protein
MTYEERLAALLASIPAPTFPEAVTLGAQFIAKP